MTAGGAARPLPDAAARREAATRFDWNLVVTAGAGTGKTALLVERALNLIGSGTIGIEAMAIITFTEKAAAELRERLATGLDALRRYAAEHRDAATLDPVSDAARAFTWLRGAAEVPPAAIAGRALQALQQLDVASVSTIHAFCSEILRSHPREARVDPSFQIDEGTLFEPLFDAEWERFLLDELGPEAGRAPVWREALRLPGALAAIRDLGRRLASFHLPDSAVGTGASYSAAPAAELLGPEARAARAAIRAVLADRPPIPATMDGYLRSADALLSGLIEAGVASLRRTDAPIPFEQLVAMAVPGTGKKPTAEQQRQIHAAALRAHNLLKPLAEVDEAVIASLVEAALPLAARCRERLLQSGFASFDALLRLSRDLLARHPAIRRSLASRYRTLLVDEFQDTDPLQYDILFFISGEHETPTSDPYGIRPAAGRLFIVGDPKQSIYRFRGADIDAYRRAVDHVLSCGGHRLELSASFRSPDNLIGPINTLFTDLMRPEGEDDGRFQPPYQPIASARGPIGGGSPRMEIWSIDSDRQAAGRRRAEATAIADWLAAHIGKAEATGRPLACNEVAILLRALSNVALYTQALRQAGIPFVVEGGREFYGRPEVGHLLSFLRAAACPHDAAAVLAVLRSPLGGVPDDELARFAAAGGRLDRIDAKLFDGGSFPNLRRTDALLEAFRVRLPLLSPDETVRAALRDTPLQLLYASTLEGAQRVANMEKLGARAEELARLGLSLEEVLLSLERENSVVRSEGDSPLADEKVEAVRVLSIHKAKGLEYPVVILPDIGREAGGGSEGETDVAWLEQAGRGWLAVRAGGSTLNTARVHHQIVNRKHAIAEEKRVFYVGCTRASERLILINSNRGRTAPWRDALRALSYEVTAGWPAPGELSPGVVHRLLAPSSRPAHQPAAEVDPLWRRAAEAFGEVAASLAAATEPPVRRPADAERMVDDEAGDDRTADPASPHSAIPPSQQRLVARVAGSIVHAALERWDFNDAARLQTLARRAADRILASPAVVDSADRPPPAAVLAEVVSILEAFVASPIPARLAAADIVGREMPILFQDEDGRVWSGTCDLVYRDDAGCLVAADYKSERPDPDAEAAARRYRQQMEIYVEALRRGAPGERVRGEIVFLRTGEAVALDGLGESVPALRPSSRPASTRRGGRGPRPSRRA
jgi:ATP-dependent helicase/nuclease subunit A